MKQETSSRKSAFPKPKAFAFSEPQRFPVLFRTAVDGFNNDRPNQVGNPVLSGLSRTHKIQGFFNISAFAQVPPGVPYGTVGRNTLIGPGRVNTDLSAFKN